jgi:hypothetical protein
MAEAQAALRAQRARAPVVSREAGVEPELELELELAQTPGAAAEAIAGG